MVVEFARFMRQDIDAIERWEPEKFFGYFDATIRMIKREEEARKKAQEKR